MSRLEHIEPVFVELIPRELEPGKLYVSMTYATTAHLCASGCGNRVVLPLSPAQWQLNFDGESVSLTPSVGNWSYPCQSHYWIRRNKIQWAGRWDRDRVEAGRRNDQRDVDNYFKGRTADDHESIDNTSHSMPFWRRVFRKRR